VGNYGVESLALSILLFVGLKKRASNQLCDFLAYENRETRAHHGSRRSCVALNTSERSLQAASLFSRWGKVTSNYVTAEAEGMLLFSSFFLLSASPATSPNDAR